MTDAIAAENKALVRDLEHGQLMERWVVSDLHGLLEESGAVAGRKRSARLLGLPSTH